MTDNCIREYRAKRGWTQQQLADRVDGVTRGRIAAWETGARYLQDASFSVMLRVADAFKMSNPPRLMEAPKEPKESTSES